MHLRPISTCSAFEATDSTAVLRHLVHPCSLSATVSNDASSDRTVLTAHKGLGRSASIPARKSRVHLQQIRAGMYSYGWGRNFLTSAQAPTRNR